MCIGVHGGTARIEPKVIGLLRFQDFDLSRKRIVKAEWLLTHAVS